MLVRYGFTAASTKSLPMPEIKLTEFVAPRSETEKAICDAMAAVLQLEQVGIDDDFFKLGGTSLAALKLQYQSGLKWLSVRAITEGKTARRIVQQIIDDEQKKRIKDFKTIIMLLNQ